MADWSDLQRDASSLGGLLYWPLSPPEGQDVTFDLPGVLTDDEGDPFDFTACSEPVAKVIDPGTEAVIASMEWVPAADGTFSFTMTRTDIADAAGDKRAYPRRPLEWACGVTIPGGYHVQLVAVSPFTVHHKGV